MALKPLDKTSEWRVAMEAFRRGNSEKGIRVKHDSWEFEDQCGQQGKGTKWYHTTFLVNRQLFDV